MIISNSYRLITRFNCKNIKFNKNFRIISSNFNYSISHPFLNKNTLNNPLDVFLHEIKSKNKINHNNLKNKKNISDQVNDEYSVSVIPPKSIKVMPCMKEDTPALKNFVETVNFNCKILNLNFNCKIMCIYI